MADLHYALVVGINEYPDFPPSLHGPLNDANGFARWLECSAGVPKGNIHVVAVTDAQSSTVDAKPNRIHINDELLTIINQVKSKIATDPQRWPETRLYIYLSGHGVSPSAHEAALLMANVRRGMMGEAIPSGRYANFFIDSQFFAELVVFADCCRTLQLDVDFAGPPFNLGGARYGNVKTFVGFATGFGDLAYEPSAEDQTDPDSTRGYFTKALLEGLSWAVDTANNEINSTSVAKYVRSRVEDLTRSKRKPQTPVMSADPANPIVFKMGEGPALRNINIRFPSGFDGIVELYDSSFNLKARNPQAAGGHAWAIQLPDGLYEIRPADSVNGDRFASSGLFRVLGGGVDIQL